MVSRTREKYRERTRRLTRPVRKWGEMGDVVTCALCRGMINPDSHCRPFIVLAETKPTTAVVCTSGNNIIHFACGVIAFTLQDAPKFNLDCQCMFGQDPAEGETEALACVGFSVGEVWTAALADTERMKEAALKHEMQFNDILMARMATEGDSRALVVHTQSGGPSHSCDHSRDPGDVAP